MAERKRRSLVAKTDECDYPFETSESFKGRFPGIVNALVESCQDEKTIDHIDAVAIPYQGSVIELIEDLRDLLYPGYFGNQEIDRDYLPYHIGSEVNVIFEKLSQQIARAIRHECLRTEIICTHCLNRGQAEAICFLEKTPHLRKTLAGDVRAAYNGDPAARSVDEIVFSYPAIMAITTYRIAHELYVRSIPLLPRMMTEYAHSVTGIDLGVCPSPPSLIVKQGLVAPSEAARAPPAARLISRDTSVLLASPQFSMWPRVSLLLASPAK